MPENQYARGTGQTGVFATIDGSTQRAVPQVEETIHMVDPNDAPFTYILDEIGGVEEVGSMTFHQQLEHPIQRDMQVTAKNVVGGATVDETHTVDDTSFIRPGDVYINLRTREQGRVISVTNATTFEGTRGLHSKALAEAVGDPLVVLHIVLYEASDRVQLLVRGTEYETFYTEHTAHAIGVSEWAKLQEVRGPDELDRVTRQKIKYFNTGREYASILSQGGTSTAGTKAMPIFTQRGLLELCEDHNRVSMNKNPSFDGMAGAVQHNARYSQNRALAGLTSLAVLNLLNRFEELRDAYRVPAGASELKMDVREYSFPGGSSITLILSPVLDRPYLDNKILTLDWDVIGRKRFSGMDPRAHVEDLGSFRQEDQIAVNEGLYAKTTWALGVIEDLF